MWKRLFLATAWGLIALLGSFFIANFSFIYWYSRTDPRDGQAGLAALMSALYIAIAAGTITSAVMIIRKR